MRFPNSFLDEIRERIPIADVVGRRVTFDRKKSNPAKGDFWACCPFHGEKTPSFHCENQKGRYHCFGCGVSGDHFRFLTELDGLSFPEAVERLADEAGLPMPVMDKRAVEREEKKASLYDVMVLAAQFFRDQLQTADGAKARAYLRDRGLSTSVQGTFGMGYARNNRSALKEFLAGKGIEKEKIEACGLVVYGPDIPVSYDRFRDRIMFPILDAKERVIAFGGRALSADVPAKYLNSPETDLFSKSYVLYNYARARRAVDREQSLIVCEGYMDVIALHAAGFENAVAPLGTALTEAQLELAWRVGGEPVLCFDGDGAGLRAAHRSIDTALGGLKPGRSLRFALLPEGKDPDDVVSDGGPEAFGEVLGAARPLADMIWSRETQGKTYDTPERRAELEQTFRQVVGLIQDESVKRHYQQDIRDRLASFFGPAGGERGNQRGQRREGGYRNNQQRRAGEGSQRRFAVSESLMNSPLVKARTQLPPLRETTLVVTIANHPALASENFDEFADLDLEHTILKRVQSALLNLFAGEGERGELPTLDLVKQGLAEAGLTGEFDMLERQVRENRVWQAMETAAFEDALDGWQQALALHQRARSLRDELKVAERSFAEIGDEASFERLDSIRQELAREDGTDALIEGFGAPSGRPTRGF